MSRISKISPIHKVAPPSPAARPAPDLADNRDCMACNSELCRLLSISGMNGIRSARSRRLERDETLFEEGQENCTLGVVQSGYLRKVRVSSDGRRTVLGLVMPGDIAGELPRRRIGYELEAASDVEICLFDGQTLRAIMASDGRVRLSLLQLVARQAALMDELIWQRGALSARERILAFLVMAARSMPVEPQTDGSLIVTIDVSRRDWADLSNTSVESISRTMSQLSDKGLVKTIAPGRFWFRNLDVLARMAGVEHRPGATAPRASDHFPTLKSA